MLRQPLQLVHGACYNKTTATPGMLKTIQERIRRACLIKDLRRLAGGQGVIESEPTEIDKDVDDKVLEDTRCISAETHPPFPDHGPGQGPGQPIPLQRKDDDDDLAESSESDHSDGLSNSIRAPLTPYRPRWSELADLEEEEEPDFGGNSEEEEGSSDSPPGPPPPVPCRRPSGDTGAGDAEPRQPGIYFSRGESREGMYQQVSQWREDDYWDQWREDDFSMAGQAGDAGTMPVAAGAPCDVFNPWVGRCVGRGVRLGAENLSDGASCIWTFGNLEIWNLETLTCGIQQSYNNYNSQNQNPCHPKCRQGLD